MTGIRMMSPAEYRARVARGMSEDLLQAKILGLAKELGWKAYHTYDSRRSQAGWPDLALVSAKRRRFLVAELKKETGVVSAEQHAWLVALAAAGIETHIWRPTDLLDETVLHVLTNEEVTHAPAPQAT